MSESELVVHLAGAGLYRIDPVGSVEGQERIAHLIAASPDLYEALEYALPYLQAAVPNPRNGINHDCSIDMNCVDRARAALARARGEQP